MKKRIIVTEPMSTSFGFLEDIRSKGYEPVIIEAYIPDGYARRMMDKERKIKYSRIEYPITIIKEDPDYQVTLEQVRDLDPLLVICGGEEGVIIGTRLAADLGLPGNPVSSIPKMTQKSVMHDTLRDAGLRHIHGREVTSCEDCLSFLAEAGTEDVVLKHVHGVASVGVHLVHGREEVLEAFRQEETAENMFGEEDNRLLLQERIFGEEYIVNTMSRNGVPALTSVLKYYKKRMPSDAIVYRGFEVIMELDDREKELVQYAFDTVQALGITDGPVHGEYMLDENGPILIEVNCRVMGGSIPAGYMDKVFGYHETEVVLDSMLDIDFHREFKQRTYRPLRLGYAKDFYSDRDRPITSSGIVPILTNMKSFYSGWVENAGMTNMIHETIDLETETGCAYLVHDDPEVVRNDFDTLMIIEEKYPDLFHSDGFLFNPPENDADMTEEIRDILSMDTETLITKIISYYRKGAQGDPVVPEALLEADPYNREIMELLKRIS